MNTAQTQSFDLPKLKQEFDTSPQISIGVIDPHQGHGPDSLVVFKIAAKHQNVNFSEIEQGARYAARLGFSEQGFIEACNNRGIWIEQVQIIPEICVESHGRLLTPLGSEVDAPDLMIRGSMGNY